MPHQCVRCGVFYEDGNNAILTGCSCGGKLFFYIKQDKLKEIQEKTAALSEDEKKEIEQDIFDLAGSEVDKSDPVVLDLEAIRILKPGQYELDLTHLFKEDPLIYKLEDGKYMIDLISTFRSIRKNKKS